MIKIVASVLVFFGAGLLAWWFAPPFVLAGVQGCYWIAGVAAAVVYFKWGKK